MPKLTLSMIVKNEEKYLRECLNSVKNVVDEIVLVDTGSTDNTIKIAEEYGAKVYTFDWINDFSAARNYALGKSTGDWILYLDADERLDNNSVTELKKIISQNSLAAYYCTVKSYDSEGSRDNSLQYTRLFFNLPGISFYGKVHEQIESSLIDNNYSILSSNVLIHHIGYDVSLDEKRRKALRNLSLLEEEYEIKQSAYGAFQIAQSYNILDDKSNARKYFLLAGESVDLEASLRAQCYAALSLMAHSENDVPDSVKYIQTSLKLDPNQPFTYLLASKISLRIGDYDNADLNCKTAHQLNQKIISGKGHSKVTIILDPEEVIYFGLIMALQNNKVSSYNYFFGELSSFYNKKEYKQGSLKLAVLQKLLNSNILSSSEETAFVNMANKNTLNFLLLVISNNPDGQQIIKLTNELLNKFPGSIEISKALAKQFDKHGRTAEAIQTLEKTIENNQYDPAILFYLISFYSKNGLTEKIIPIVTLLENDYGNVPEIVDRINKLKKMLPK